MTPDSELLDEEFFEELESKLARDVIFTIQSQCGEIS
jgi:spermidine synthase